MSPADAIRRKAEWQIEKLNEPTGEMVAFLQAGRSIEEAKKRFWRTHCYIAFRQKRSDERRSAKSDLNNKIA